MARSLDARQQKELTDFVNALAERAGFETTAEWARASGYPAPNLSNLRRGKAAIDGYNLLRLIQAAAEQDGASPADVAVGVVRESTSEQIRELADLVKKALAMLEHAQTQGEQQKREAPRARRRTR